MRGVVGGNTVTLLSGPALSFPTPPVCSRGPCGWGKSATSRHCRPHPRLQSSGCLRAGPVSEPQFPHLTGGQGPAGHQCTGLAAQHARGRAACTPQPQPRPAPGEQVPPALALALPGPARPAPVAGAGRRRGAFPPEARPWRVQAPIRAHMASGTSAFCLFCPGSRQPFLPGREPNPAEALPSPTPSSGPGGVRSQVAASGPLPSGVAPRSPAGSGPTLQRGLASTPGLGSDRSGAEAAHF